MEAIRAIVSKLSQNGLSRHCQSFRWRLCVVDRRRCQCLPGLTTVDIFCLGALLALFHSLIFFRFHAFFVGPHFFSQQATHFFVFHTLFCHRIFRTLRVGNSQNASRHTFGGLLRPSLTFCSTAQKRHFRHTIDSPPSQLPTRHRFSLAFTRCQVRTSTTWLMEPACRYVVV